jgi:hypothetical protein
VLAAEDKKRLGRRFLVETLTELDFLGSLAAGEETPF